MSYASIASEVKSLNSTFVSYVSSNFKVADFSNVWTGPAATTLLDDMKSTIDKVTQNTGYVDSFVSALQDLETYKTKKLSLNTKNDNLKSKQSQLANTPNDEKHANLISTLNGQISTLQTDINKLETELKTLKQKIVSSLGSVSSIGSTATVKSSVDASSDLDGYVVDLYELLSTFESGKLSQMNGSLYDYYSKEEVQATLDDVQSKYSGRDAAVNSALAIISLASAKGKKLDYVYGGGHNSSAVTSTDNVATGVDCSAFVSWAVQQGATSEFSTTTAAYLCNRGSYTTYENAKKGDILVCGAHAILIVDNDPEAKAFLVAEATSSGGGVVIRKRTYSSVNGEYQVRDLSSVYA